MVITDTERPTWDTPPDSVDKELQMPVDGTCSLLALEAFNRSATTAFRFAVGSFGRCVRTLDASVS